MAIALNEDNSHFFCWHPREEMTVAGLDAWLDQYAGTQVSELLFCTNSQRSNLVSQSRQSVWDGFDPGQGNDQPFFAGMRDHPFFFHWGARTHMRRWVEHVWLLHQQGIDPYAHWIARSRSHGISPWLSMRMNDVHYVDEPQHPIHDGFWKAHPEYRRDPENDPYNGQCFDYGVPEVRAYQLAYVQELLFRYNMDGFELDWMRNPFYFRPGMEEAGCAVLTEFVGQVRKLVDQRQRELDHPIKLSARVPSRPETARGLGMEVASWAQKGFVDKLVAAPFLISDFDMPIERWKELLKDTGVTLATGLDMSVRLDAGAHNAAHNLETLRGATSSFLDRGADQIYLFNFMDNFPGGTWGEAYRTSLPAEVYRRLLREIGAPETTAGKSRRHVVSSPDTRAPGEKKTPMFPRDCPVGERVVFRLPTGPALQGRQQGQVRLALESQATGDTSPLEIHVNGARCPDAGEIMPLPDGTEPLHAFSVPAGAIKRGENLIEMQNRSQTPKRLIWVELAVSDSEGKWPLSGVEITSIYPGLGR
ncbi:MAG: hypothetical protein V1800_17405 [Candidatus Latescibacterota bacterium]